MDPQQAQTQAMHMMMAILPIMFLVGAVVMAFLVFVFWRIFAKAGMAGALSLLILIPGIGWIIAICILAFSDWRVAPIPPPVYYPPAYPPATPPTQL